MGLQCAARAFAGESVPTFLNDRNSSSTDLEVLSMSQLSDRCSDVQVNASSTLLVHVESCAADLDNAYPLQDPPASGPVTLPSPCLVEHVPGDV